MRHSTAGKAGRGDAISRQQHAVLPAQIMLYYRTKSYLICPLGESAPTSYSLRSAFLTKSSSFNSFNPSFALSLTPQLFLQSSLYTILSTRLIRPCIFVSTSSLRIIYSLTTCQCLVVSFLASNFSTISLSSSSEISFWLTIKLEMLR